MKKFKILDQKTGKWEYTFTIEEDVTIKYKLFYSEMKEWTNPGEMLMSIEDTGNGFVMESSISEEVDYNTFDVLYTLFRMIRLNDENLCPDYEFINFESIVSL